MGRREKETEGDPLPGNENNSAAPLGESRVKVEFVLSNFTSAHRLK